MNNSSGISKTVGHLASVLAALGVLTFFFGIFGGPRMFAFAGVAMIVASLVGFFVEEQGSRR